MNIVIEQLCEYKNQFIDYLRLEQKKSRHTCASYNLDLGKCITFAKKLSTQTPLTIPLIFQEYVQDLHQSNLTKSSVARKISCFSAFLRFLNEKGINVEVLLFRPPVKEKPPRIFVMEEILELLTKTNDYRIKARCYMRERAIWELLCATGIRCSEIVVLSVDDVCLQERKVKIKDSKNMIRILFFQERTAQFLQEYLQIERPTYNPKENFLFLNSFGNKLTTRAIQRSLKLLAKLLKIEAEITPHILRHSYATHALKNGDSIEHVKINLGLRAQDTVEKYIPYAKI